MPVIRSREELIEGGVELTPEEIAEMIVDVVYNNVPYSSDNEINCCLKGTLETLMRMDVLQDYVISLHIANGFNVKFLPVSGLPYYSIDI